MSFGNIRRICRDLLINGFTGSYVVPRSLRRILYQIFGYKIGKNCEIAPKCFFGHGHGTLVLGEDTFVNYRCQFDLGDDITVGDNCNIAMNVLFCTNSHEIGGASRRAGKEVYGSIVVGDGSWIGADTTIMGGVHIGKGVIIGIGSLVMANCEDDSIYVGRPARKIRNL